MDNQTKIIELISRVTGKAVDIDPDESLFDAGILDSFELDTLIAAMETEFSFKVPNADLNPRKFSTIERIVSYVESHAA